jgi:hypothetical protein
VQNDPNKTQKVVPLAEKFAQGIEKKIVERAKLGK